MTKKPAEMIDDCLWQMYVPGNSAATRMFSLGGNELPMLAKLFGEATFGTTLKEAAAAFTGESTRLSIAWVDKRPVAAVTGIKRTEYGDLAVFRVHGFSTSGGGSSFRAHCLLVQAKIAREVNQLDAPSVPVNPTRPRPGSSTAREFDLLSTWPKHDMYKYGSSGTKLVSNLTVANANAWYMATPQRSPCAPATAWRSPWMCGPVVSAAKCDVSLGELLMAFLGGTKVFRASTNSTEPVGTPFALDLRELGRSAVPTSNGWDRICVEILRGMRGFDLPAYLTKGTKKSGINTIKLYSNPVEPLWEMVVRGWEFFRRRFGRSKMLVVVVSSYSKG